MLPSRLTAALIMPLALGSLRASAQMVPVESLSAATESTSVYTPAAPPAYGLASAAPPAAVGGAAAGVQLPPPPKGHVPPHIGPFSTVALGLTGGTLGAGVELAAPLARSFNLRIGGGYFNLTYPFTIDGVNYNTGMRLVSGQGLLDWYPKRGGFHLSAGALYFKNAVEGLATVDPGQQFKLGGTTYINSVDDPVQGTASLKFQKRVAPVVLMGFGNLVPRSGRHFSVPFEIGGAYFAPPQVGLQFAGTACTTQGCFNAATDPAVLANLANEEAKLNRDIRPLQIYPIVSLGFALRF